MLLVSHQAAVLSSKHMELVVIFDFFLFIIHRFNKDPLQDCRVFPQTNKDVRVVFFSADDPALVSQSVSQSVSQLFNGL